jgi:hypothetical protein
MRPQGLLINERFHLQLNTSKPRGCCMADLLSRQHRHSYQTRSAAAQEHLQHGTLSPFKVWVVYTQWAYNPTATCKLTNRKNTS